MRKGFFLICLILTFSVCGCAQPPALQRSTQVLMGTFVEVISFDPRAAGIVFAEIKRIEDLLSKYRPDSQVSQLNRSGRVKAGPELLYILKRSRDFWEASEGAFDITVGPLMDVWGFTERDFRVPSKDRVSKALALVGANKIIFNPDDSVVKFMIPEMEIDLGAIAKGFAVDCAVKKLKEAGICGCLINAGGQIYGLGSRSGRPWKIAIRSPREKGFSGYLEIKDQAVSTSGDYEQYFEKDKRRFSHIMDPRTGYPADSGIISVTVIAGDGLTADALSTSIAVLGEEKGLLLAKKFPGVQTRIIKRSDR